MINRFKYYVMLLLALCSCSLNKPNKLIIVEYESFVDLTHEYMFSIIDSTAKYSTFVRVDTTGRLKSIYSKKFDSKNGGGYFTRIGELNLMGNMTYINYPYIPLGEQIDTITFSERMYNLTGMKKMINVGKRQVQFPSMTIVSDVIVQYSAEQRRDTLFFYEPANLLFGLSYDMSMVVVNDLYYTEVKKKLINLKNNDIELSIPSDSIKSIHTLADCTLYTPHSYFLNNRHLHVDALDE